MTEGIGMYRGLGPSNMFEVSFVGARQIILEALEVCLYSSKGYKRRPAGLLYWGGRPSSFSAGIGTLSAALGNLSAGTATRRSA